MRCRWRVRLSVVAPGMVGVKRVVSRWVGMFLRGVYCRPRVCGSPCPLVTGDGGLVALRCVGVGASGAMGAVASGLGGLVSGGVVSERRR